MKNLEMTTFNDALNIGLEAVPLIKNTEYLMLDNALSRVLAEDIICIKNLPSFDNSALDGFAFRHEDTGKKLNIVATIFAGDKPISMLKKQECYRVMTGAQLPSDVDTVVAIEDCLDLNESSVAVPQSIKRANAFRKKGEEQRSGSVLMKRGEVLGFSRIAMLSAQGIVGIKVYAKLKIAVLSTGNEIREPWQEADEDEIYNANAFGITALLREHGFSPVYAGSIPDDLSATVAIIERLKSYDVVITTGGISMGDADFLEEAYVASGIKILFHGVNVKPGHPTMMGQMGDTFVMAMPGNPMTTLLNIFLLSVPILRKYQGQTSPKHQSIRATISQTLKLKASRSNLVLGRVEEGIFYVTRNNKIGSGMLTPLMESNAVAIFDEGIAKVAEGETIKAILF